MPASAIRRDDSKFRLIQTGRVRADPPLPNRGRLAIRDFLLICGWIIGLPAPSRSSVIWRAGERHKNRSHWDEAVLPGLMNQGDGQSLLRPDEPAVRNSVVKRRQTYEHQRGEQAAFPPSRFASPGLSSRVIVVSITCTFDAFFRHISLPFFGIRKRSAYQRRAR